MVSFPCGPVTKKHSSYSLPSSFSYQEEKATKVVEELLLKLCSEEDPHATNCGLWKTERCTTQLPHQEKPLPSSTERALCTAPVVSIFRTNSAFQLGVPALGTAPTECLSKTELVKSTLFLASPPGDDHQERSTLLLCLPPPLLHLLLSSSSCYSDHLNFSNKNFLKKK